MRYFHTHGDESSGSFVPLEKFSQGSDLVKALKSRYAALGEEGYDDEDMFVSTTSNKSKRVELVGLNKIENRQKRTELLTAVDLSGGGISQLVRKGVLEEGRVGGVGGIGGGVEAVVGTGGVECGV